MSSLPTFKELTKALQAFVPVGTLPLPDHLVELLEGYVNKHEEKHEEAIAEKVNEELISLFHKDVVSAPHLFGPFVAILRRLRPLIGQPDKTLRWFNLLMPLLGHLNHQKGLANEAQSIVLEILTEDTEKTITESFPGGVAVALAERIANLWLEECEVAKTNAELTLSFKEKLLRDTLLQYGRKHPKDLLLILDRRLLHKEHRSLTLLLLADFVKSQPPHLHVIIQTPLFGNLLSCLQLDTSTTIVSLALTVLTMILPHTPSSLVPHLPTLFNIYARCLFWDRGLPLQTDDGAEIERRPSPNAMAWEKCEFSPQFDGMFIPQLTHYFTILYGLYPINFMDYIRKPQRYLRHTDTSDSDDVEVQPTEIREASERFRRCHLLHQNFYTLTVESEKTDLGRFIKSEPAEVVADCMALCQSPENVPHLGDQEDDGHDGASAGERTGPPAAHDSESALLSRSLPFGSPGLGVHDASEYWPSMGSSMPDNQSRPTLIRKASQNSRQSAGESLSSRPLTTDHDNPSLVRQPGSQTQLQDMINSNKAIKSGLHQSMANDSVPSLALSHHESVPERPASQLQSSTTAEDPQAACGEHCKGAQYAHLCRQILLLQNDLTFERFMKQQHLTHMGELRRRQLQEAASEADTQNLIISNRHLKQRLDEAKKSEIQLKKESESRRALATNREASMTEKLRKLREEQKNSLAEEKKLRSELETAKKEADKLVRLVCEAEVRELALKQNMQSVDTNVTEFERLRQEVTRLTESERDHQAKELERQTALSRAEEAGIEAESVKMRLAAAEQDLRQTHEHYERQIATMRAKLRELREARPEDKPASRDADETVSDGEDSDEAETPREERRVESETPAASKLRASLSGATLMQNELRKRLAELSKKNRSLQNKILELQAAQPMMSSSQARPPAVDSSADSSSETEGPFAFRNRRSRGLSDPHSATGTSYNATPPLEPYHSISPATSQAGSAVRRPSTPMGTDLTSLGKYSPTSERAHGRGGLPSLRRKDRDKNKDREGDKDKEKDRRIRKLTDMSGLHGGGWG